MALPAISAKGKKMEMIAIDSCEWERERLSRNIVLCIIYDTRMCSPVHKELCWSFVLYKCTSFYYIFDFT